MKKLQLVVKRIVDIVISGAGLIVFAPFLIIIAILIKTTSKGPVFYKQVRVGKDEKLFKILKFRTMNVGAESVKDGLAVSEGDTRVTSLGRTLRKASLDELPQFFNVLLGDISIVGPRPALPEQLHYYNREQLKRLNMRPGITGLATVKGRCSIPWSRRIELDLEYIERFSLMLDVKIMFQTVWVVLSGKNTYFDNTNGPAFDLSDPDDLPQSGVVKEKRN